MEESKLKLTQQVSGDEGGPTRALIILLVDMSVLVNKEGPVSRRPTPSLPSKRGSSLPSAPRPKTVERASEEVRPAGPTPADLKQWS